MTLSHAERMFFDPADTSVNWQISSWGTARCLTEFKRFKVRHLIIKPGQAIGLQGHFHSSKHWQVVSGSARVTIADQPRDLFENQSVDIPVGRMHSLENHGLVDLHLIEVQTGPYLGDDDILTPENGCAA